MAWPISDFHESTTMGTCPCFAVPSRQYLCSLQKLQDSDVAEGYPPPKSGLRRTAANELLFYVDLPGVGHAALGQEEIGQYADLVGDLCARILEEMSSGHVAVAVPEAVGEYDQDDGGITFDLRAIIDAMFQENVLMLAVDWEEFGYATWEPVANCVAADVSFVGFIDTLLILL